MKEFAFKPIDQEGEDTLNTIALAKNLNAWMYETIKPYCKGHILEVGSGVGNISEYFLKDHLNIFLSDIREVYCKSLHAKFGYSPSLLGIETIDLVDADFDQKHVKHFGKYDTVYALNVVEHIFDDAQAIANCYKLLKPEGHLIVLVPAYQTLYNTFDKELEHYRRYNRKKLELLFTTNGFAIVKSWYFNAAGIAGWYVSGKLQRNKTIPGDQIKLYNILVPLFKLLDRLLGHSIGLSVITVGKKR